MSAKKVKKLFNKYGTIERVWFRSVPVKLDSKVPLKAKIIRQDFGDQKDNKNAYILYQKVEYA